MFLAHRCTIFRPSFAVSVLHVSVPLMKMSQGGKVTRYDGGGEDFYCMSPEDLHLIPHSTFRVLPLPPIYFQPCHFYQECIVDTKSFQETIANVSSPLEFYLGQ